MSTDDTRIMDLEAFALALIARWRDHHGCDLDGGEFEDLAVKHGLLIERPATAQEAKEDFCVDWDIGEGEKVITDSPEFAALRQRAKEAA